MAGTPCPTGPPSHTALGNLASPALPPTVSQPRAPLTTDCCAPILGRLSHQVSLPSSSRPPPRSPSEHERNCGNEKLRPKLENKLVGKEDALSLRFELPPRGGKSQAPLSPNIWFSGFRDPLQRLKCSVYCVFLHYLGEKGLIHAFQLILKEISCSKKGPCGNREGGPSFSRAAPQDPGGWRVAPGLFHGPRVFF